MRKKVAKLLKKLSIARHGSERNQKDVRAQWNSLDHRSRGREHRKIKVEITAIEAAKKREGKK